MVEKIRSLLNGSNWVGNAKDIVFNEWIKRGEKVTVDLKKILFQDKVNKIKVLDQLNLPRIGYMHLGTNNYKQHEKELCDFIEKYKPVFARLYPYKYGDKRPYDVDINSVEDLFSFVENASVNLKNYELHLEQSGSSEYAGNIMRADERLFGELIRGNHLNLSQGHETPMNVSLEFHGFRFSNDFEYTEYEKRLLLRSVKMTWGINGYFEFMVKDKKILFMNYQSAEGFSDLYWW